MRELNLKCQPILCFSPRIRWHFRWWQQQSNQSSHHPVRQWYIILPAIACSRPVTASILGQDKHYHFKYWPEQFHHLCRRRWYFMSASWFREGPPGICKSHYCTSLYSRFYSVYFFFSFSPQDCFEIFIFFVVIEFYLNKENSPIKSVHCL